MGVFGCGNAEWYEEGGKDQRNKGYGKKHGGSAMGVTEGGLHGVGGQVLTEDSVGVWAELDAEAGGDTEWADGWCTPGVYAGLSIPNHDHGPPGKVFGDVEPSTKASSGAGAQWLKEDRWKDWMASSFYRKTVLYKLRGESFLMDPTEDIGRNEAKLIRHRARRFVTTEASQARLFYKERSGRLAVCVLEPEIPKVLHSLHNIHGHFATGVTIGRAYGDYYWPTRDRDIAHWVSTWIYCQRCHTKLWTAELKPIAQFWPMDMLAMDYFGPISSACKGSGARYILVMLDYYSRFVFAQPVACADQVTTMAMLLNTVVPVVGVAENDI
jgi:hypothetical protein